MLENIRPYLTKLLNPIAKVLNINPNILTLIAPLIALIATYFFAEKNLIIAALLILFSGFFDVLDGAVARYNNKTSEFGALLDSTMDRVSDGILIIGIVLGGYCNWIIGILAVHSSIMVSYVKARGEAKNFECNVGIAERAVRLLLIVLGAIIGNYFGEIYFTYIMIIFVILSYITVVQRMYHIWNQSKSL